jgi:phage-related holin
MNVILGLKSFFMHFYSAMGNVFFAILSMIAYLIGYPAQEGILIAALVLFISDIITRFYAIGIQNKGLMKAFKAGKLSSRGFWNGFVTKVIGYFIILTIANLAIVTPQVSIIGTIVSTICYVGLFFYEVISNFENLRDANFLVAIPILNRLKKEQNKFLESETVDNPISAIVQTQETSTSNDSTVTTVSNEGDDNP